MSSQHPFTELKNRFAHTYAGASGMMPPRMESAFSEEVVSAWRNDGLLDDRTPEKYFGLNQREELEITWWGIPERRPPLIDEASLAALRNAYAPNAPGRFPEDWTKRVQTAQERSPLIEFAPWNEGLFQILGIADGDSLDKALTALCNQPSLAQAAMEHYADYLEEVLDQFLDTVTPDYALFYEPIASNHGPVISPEMYARIALPALRRIAARLEKNGIAARIVWSAGAAKDFIPIWLDAGLNGLYLNQAGQAGVSYRALRRQYGPQLRLLGGVDWRTVVESPAAAQAFLETEIFPLLETGCCFPYLDDTIRAYMPFRHFQKYRECLDKRLETG